MSEVVRITPTETWTTVKTSDGIVSSEIKLSRVGQRYVIEDIILTNEASPSKQFALLQSTRQQIAAGQLLPKGANVQRAHYETPVTAPVGSPVQQATFEPISPEVYRR